MGNDSTAESISCVCTHLTDFAIGVLVPTVVTLDSDDFSNLTFDNLIKHPTASIVVILTLGVYLLLVPLALWQDERKKRIRLRHISSGQFGSQRLDSLDWRRNSSQVELTRRSSLADQQAEKEVTPERSVHEEKLPEARVEHVALVVSPGQRRLHAIVSEYDKLEAERQEMSGVEMNSSMSSVSPYTLDLYARDKQLSSRNGERPE